MQRLYNGGMKLSSPLRKLALTMHVVLSLGWLGAVIAYVALAITGVSGTEINEVRAAFVSMELIGWRVIVPLSIGGLASGLVMSATTEWGFFRHYWVIAKLVMTAVGTGILLAHMPRVSEMARTVTLPDASMLPKQLLLHAVGGLVLLLAIASISVFKPWGKTPWFHAR
jgi:hypothetical protein